MLRADRMGIVKGNVLEEFLMPECWTSNLEYVIM
jgi:hypothetical protein